MAERRMFAKTIIDSDAFLDMPMSTRLLYYDLGMRADDDGFVNSPKKIMKICGNTDDDLKMLIAKRFVIGFESGIIVIKHWRLNNYLRKDRYQETNYRDEKAMLAIEENRAYRLANEPIGIPTGVPTVDAGKVSIGKVSIGKVSIVNTLTDNTDLQKALKDFADMRNKLKKPLTDRATELIYAKLQKLSDSEETQVKILEQSIANSWQGVFALKDGEKTGERDTKKDIGKKWNIETTVV